MQTCSCCCTMATKNILFRAYFHRNRNDWTVRVVSVMFPKIIVPKHRTRLLFKSEDPPGGLVVRGWAPHQGRSLSRVGSLFPGFFVLSWEVWVCVFLQIEAMYLIPENMCYSGHFFPRSFLSLTFTTIRCRCLSGFLSFCEIPSMGDPVLGSFLKDDDSKVFYLRIYEPFVQFPF